GRRAVGRPAVPRLGEDGVAEPRPGDRTAAAPARRPRARRRRRGARRRARPAALPAALRARGRRIDPQVAGRRAGRCAVTRANLALAALAACGNVPAFQPDGGGPGGGSDGGGNSNTITLRLTSDAYSTDPAGQPIANATVLVDRGTGTLDRLATDTTGT